MFCVWPLIIDDWWWMDWHCGAVTRGFTLCAVRCLAGLWYSMYSAVWEVTWLKAAQYVLAGYAFWRAFRVSGHCSFMGGFASLLDWPFWCGKYSFRRKRILFLPMEFKNEYFYSSPLLQNCDPACNSWSLSILVLLSWLIPVVILDQNLCPGPMLMLVLALNTG